MFVQCAFFSTVLKEKAQGSCLRDKIKLLSGKNCNVSRTVLDSVDRNLLSAPRHPLSLIMSKIKKYFSAPRPLFVTEDIIKKTFFPAIEGPKSPKSIAFEVFDNISPIVSIYDNFDALGIKNGHPARSPTDTYYINEQMMLRTHMTTHESEFLNRTPQHLSKALLLAGDVYRRDQIDSLHYPIFHQLELVRRFGEDERAALEHFSRHMDSAEKSLIYSKLALPLDSIPAPCALVLLDLQLELEGLVSHMLGPSVSKRWVAAEFPFTDPSFELEIKRDSEYVEILGFGLLTNLVLQSKEEPPLAWAAGLGLERLAMIFYEIPDIRLFWSRDERFLSQFAGEDRVTFRPFSKHPPVIRDISFWLPEDVASIHPNEINELVRGCAGVLVEKSTLIDEYIDGSTGARSQCYRVVFRSLERYVECFF